MGVLFGRYSPAQQNNLFCVSPPPPQQEWSNLLLQKSFAKEKKNSTNIESGYHDHMSALQTYK